MPISRLTLIAITAGALITLVRQVAALLPTEVYAKDFTQEYLLARAILDGFNPYAPQPVLATRYLPEAQVLPQVGSHPPFAALLSVPFGLVPYEAAAGVWLGIELALLFALAILLFVEDRPRAPVTRVLLVFGLLLLWYPVFHELFFGQLSLLLAVLLTGCWLASKNRHPRLAGLFLGAAVALKLFPALILAFFVAKRQWLTVLWASATALALTTLAGLVIGIDGVASYLSSGFLATGHWRASEVNYSVLAAAWRTFAGGLTIAPLIPAAWLAWPAGLLATGAVIAVTARCLIGDHERDVKFAATLCAVVLIGPTTWQHYLVLLIWPMAVLVRKLRARGWPRLDGNALLAATAAMAVPSGALLFPSSVLMGVWQAVAQAPMADASSVAVVGLPLLLLPVGPLLMLWLLVRDTSLERSPQAPGHAR